ncbi:hypothetical protein KAU39_06760 [bacterium]|nr:hypothetical protein [bacterium]
MKEVIDKILEVENNAGKSIEDAREQAERLVSEAKIQNEALLKETKEKAVLKGKEMIKDTQEQARTKKDKEIKEALASFVKFKAEKMKKIEEIAGDVFEKIVKV